MKYLNILILSLLKVAQPIRFLQEEAEEEVATTSTSSSSSSPITLIIIIIILVVGVIGIVYYGVTRSKSTREMNKIILESGESKLRNAFHKIEANGSKDFQSMQVIRGKIVKWEEKQRVKQQMIRGKILQQLTLKPMIGDKEGSGNKFLNDKNQKILTSLQNQDLALSKRITSPSKKKSGSNSPRKSPSMSPVNIMQSTQNNNMGGQQIGFDMGGSRDTPEHTGRAATNLKKEQVLFDEAKVISNKIEPNRRNNAVAPTETIRACPEAIEQVKQYTDADNGNIYNSDNIGIIDEVHADCQDPDDSKAALNVCSLDQSAKDRMKDLLLGKGIPKKRVYEPWELIQADPTPEDDKRGQIEDDEPIEQSEFVKVAVHLDSLGEEEECGSEIYSDQDKPKKQKQQKYVWKKASTRNDFRTHTDKFIEKFWTQNVMRDKEGKILMSTGQIDSIVHTLIHNLLLKGEDNPANVHSVHLHSSMLNHQQQIQAIKNAIKPGVIDMYFKQFTLSMIIDYSKDIKRKGGQMRPLKNTTQSQSLDQSEGR